MMWESETLPQCIIDKCKCTTRIYSIMQRSKKLITIWPTWELKYFTYLEVVLSFINYYLIVLNVFSYHKLILNYNTILNFNIESRLDIATMFTNYIHY